MGFFTNVHQNPISIYQNEAHNLVSINIPSIRSGDAGGGRKLTGKWRPKGNLHISTKPCTILRKGAHFRTQELKTLEKSLTYRRKTRRKPVEGEEDSRPENSQIRWLPASTASMAGGNGCTQGRVMFGGGGELQFDVWCCG